MSDKPAVGLLVLDLDNTVWDWFEAWYQSFNAMLEALTEASGVPLETLKEEAKVIHQGRGTTEYSFLLEELPSITALRGSKSVRELFDEVVHVQNSRRLHSTQLYPRVMTTLQRIKSRGTTVVAYTESLKYWTEWRLRLTGLDGVIDVLYSSPDHDFPAGVAAEDVRTRSPETYELRSTEHRAVDRGIVKPDPRILNEIVARHAQSGWGVAYVGDSLDKDVAMAQAVGGIHDVHARYGEAFRRPEYALLQEVSHWSDATVQQEISSEDGVHPTPSYVLEQSFDELLDLFVFGAGFDTAAHLDLWKKSVDVQMHFNDIGWRIRALALTALTFVLGATGLVYANVPAVTVGVWSFHFAAIVPVLGLVLWWAFWFMDAKWFHRLLIGSVTDGDRLERKLRDHLIDASLGGAISTESPTAAWPFRKVRHSSARLDLFYGVIGIVLGGIAIVILCLGFIPVASAAVPDLANKSVTSSPTP